MPYQYEGTSGTNGTEYPGTTWDKAAEGPLSP